MLPVARRSSRSLGCHSFYIVLSSYNVFGFRFRLWLKLCFPLPSQTLALAAFSSLATMAMAHGGDEVDMAGVVAAGIASEGHMAALEAELKQLTEDKKVLAKQVKKEKHKRDRLLAKAGKSLSVEDLSQLLAAKTAKAAAAIAKAKVKAKAKAKAAAAPALPPPPAGGEAAGPE